MDTAACTVPNVLAPLREQSSLAASSAPSAHYELLEHCWSVRTIVPSPKARDFAIWRYDQLWRRDRSTSSRSNTLLGRWGGRFRPDRRGQSCPPCGSRNPACNELGRLEPLPNQFPFKLCCRTQHMQQEPQRRILEVPTQPLGDRDEPDAVVLQDPDVATSEPPKRSSFHTGRQSIFLASASAIRRFSAGQRRL